ncbi:MAG: SDR family NAD(P)-dependent oxidoreductase, partial [Gemmatimonadaceae bacterium]|nr:SDR family NAD(P)-dependent oxidoreductase [Gemmatimonadaceae bacterium]
MNRGLTAVVTGASSGIGAGIASALAAGGARVVMIARNEEALREAASRTPSAIPLVCD